MYIVAIYIEMFVFILYILILRDS